MRRRAAAALLAGCGCAASPAAPPDAFASARFSSVAGAGAVPINVVEVGDIAAPAIVFIHGFRQSHLSWAAQFASDLPQRCHLVAFDLRGHGNSGVPWQADAYDHGEPWADDLAAVLRATGVVRPLVVGWSFGGNVAMDFARHHAEIPLSGYVLVSTTAGMWPAPKPAADAAPRPGTSPSLATNIAAVESSTALLFGAGIDAGLRDSFKAAAMRVSPYVDRAIAARAGQANVDLVTTITGPVTLVFGGKDPIVMPRQARALAMLFPAARVESFAESGHAPFLDDAPRFNALLDALQCRTRAPAPSIPAGAS